MEMKNNSQNVECPKCGAEIPITEALARPIVDAERSHLEAEMRERSAALENREQQLQKTSAELESLRKQLKAQVSDVEKLVRERLEVERSEIVSEERKRIEAEYQSKLDGARREYKAQAGRIAQPEKTEKEFRKRSAALAEQERQLELTLARRIEDERDEIRSRATEDEQARNQLAMADKERVVVELKAKLVESQKAELEVRRERERIETEKRSQDLELTRRIDSERRNIREATQKEEEERHHLKLAEKDKIIDDMRKQVEELRRRSEQTSQQ